MGNFLCKNILYNSPFLLVSLYLETFNSLIRSIETSSPLVAINIELECWKSVLCFAKVKNFAPRPDFLWLSSLKLRTQSWSLVLVLLSCLSSQKGKIVTLAPLSSTHPHLFSSQAAQSLSRYYVLPLQTPTCVYVIFWYGTKPNLYFSQCKQYTAKSSNHSHNTQNCFQ